ncbi:hypothetical protein SAMN05216388_101788 [Halorientalis persicus]|uniref:Uncharacterized protein n=1 Tax=Halorientalis persicus TaxID=1367881 RepID=A0A1H8RZ44_9EURY|nr:hypothetical protein [Halorientalis persicus]SEO71622.1 hypothetical protein SAMN05216388_101788 [Halorientalis persicus]
MQDPTDQLDVFDEVVYGAERTKSATIETKGNRADFEFEIVRPGRKIRNAVITALPEGFFEGAEDIDMDDVDGPEDIDMDDVDLGDVDIQSLTLDAEGTDAWDDMLVAGLEHDEFGDNEIRQLVEKLPEATYYGIGAEVLSHAFQGGRIDGFRVE